MYWIVFSTLPPNMLNDNVSCVLEDMGTGRKEVHGFAKFPSFDLEGSAGIRI